MSVSVEKIGRSNGRVELSSNVEPLQEQAVEEIATLEPSGVIRKTPLVALLMRRDESSPNKSNSSLFDLVDLLSKGEARFSVPESEREIRQAEIIAHSLRATSGAAKVFEYDVTEATSQRTVFIPLQASSPERFV